MEAEVMSRKAEAFRDIALQLGWDASLTQSGDRSTVTASRGNEKISITWRGNACLNEVTHSIGGKVRKLRNASAARKHMGGVSEGGSSPSSPSGGPRKAGRPRKSQPATSEADGEETDSLEYVPHKPVLPFDIDLAGNEEVLKSVIGREIIWKNSMSGNLDSARVLKNPDQKQLRIDRNAKHERCITFAAQGEGFRSVRLSSIQEIR